MNAKVERRPCGVGTKALSYPIIRIISMISQAFVFACESKVTPIGDKAQPAAFCREVL
jgi:hypothetical protein